VTEGYFRGVWQVRFPPSVDMWGVTQVLKEVEEPSTTLVMSHCRWITCDTTDAGSSRGATASLSHDSCRHYPASVVSHVIHRHYDDMSHVTVTLDQVVERHSHMTHVVIMSQRQCDMTYVIT